MRITLTVRLLAGCLILLLCWFFLFRPKEVVSSGDDEGLAPMSNRERTSGPVSQGARDWLVEPLSDLSFRDLVDEKIFEGSIDPPLESRSEMLEKASQIRDNELRAIFVAKVLFESVTESGLADSFKLLEERYFPGSFRTEVLRHSLDHLREAGDGSVFSLVKDVITEKEVSNLSFEICLDLSPEEITSLREFHISGDPASDIVGASGVMVANKVRSGSSSDKLDTVIDEVAMREASGWDSSDVQGFLLGMSSSMPFEVFEFVTSHANKGRFTKATLEGGLDKMGNQNPELAISNLKKIDSLNQYDLTNVFSKWIKSDVVAAVKGFHETEGSLMKETKQNVISQMVTFSIENGDLEAASQWNQLVEDQEKQQSFEEMLNAAQR